MLKITTHTSEEGLFDSPLFADVNGLVCYPLLVGSFTLSLQYVPALGTEAPKPFSGPVGYLIL